MQQLLNAKPTDPDAMEIDYQHDVEASVPMDIDESTTQDSDLTTLTQFFSSICIQGLGDELEEVVDTQAEAFSNLNLTISLMNQTKYVIGELAVPVEVYQSPVWEMLAVVEELVNHWHSKYERRNRKRGNRA